MEYNKGHFYLTWIIFGMICIFSSEHLIRLFNELIIIGGITINIKPDFLKYLKFIVYGIVAMILIFVSIRILLQKITEKHIPDYKELRKYLIIILGTGIIAAVSNNFLITYRMDIFEEYLLINSIEFKDIFEMLYIYSSMFWSIMFIYFTVLFFILTKKNEKLQMLTIANTK